MAKFSPTIARFPCSECEDREIDSCHMVRFPNSLIISRLPQVFYLFHAVNLLVISSLLSSALLLYHIAPIKVSRLHTRKRYARRCKTNRQQEMGRGPRDELCARGGADHDAARQEGGRRRASAIAALRTPARCDILTTSSTQKLLAFGHPGAPRWLSHPKLLRTLVLVHDNAILLYVFEDTILCMHVDNDWDTTA
jgi:hypothetical protein